MWSFILSFNNMTFNILSCFSQTSAVNLAEKKLTQTVSTYVRMLDALELWLVNHGINIIYADFVKLLIVFAAILVLAFIANWVTKRIFLTIVARIAKRTETVFDDILVERKVFHRLAHLAPALVVFYAIVLPLAEFPHLLDFIQRGTQVFITIVSLSVFMAFTNAIQDFFLTLPASKSHSIKGYLQVLKIIFYSITAITIMSILLKINALRLVSFLGASVAVLMFVFKDTILGLVASIQLSVNDMLRPGDWIEMPSRKTDGIVIDISLTTVKVQNWDKTVTTVPTYALVSDSFTNWRGMEESEGRRVKKAISIDMKTVKFYSEDLLERLSKDLIVKNVFDARKYVQDVQPTDITSDNVPIKAITNLGIFRAYMETYLAHLPVIHPEMTCLVHYLQSNEHGLPLELVFFSKHKDGKNFERIQCEIYEHILALLPEFGLKVYQKMSAD